MGKSEYLMLISGVGITSRDVDPEFYNNILYIVFGTSSSFEPSEGLFCTIDQTKITWCNLHIPRPKALASMYGIFTYIYYKFNQM